VLGDVLKFQFRGKSRQYHVIKVHDKRLAQIVRRCKDIPGSALFEYIDADGKPQSLDSGDVNEYLRTISGGEFTAKDFRTWGGTCLAANLLLAQVQNSDTEEAKTIKSALIEVVKNVACKLGNKPSTCRKYYIHPTVFEAFESGSLRTIAERMKDARGKYMYEKVVLSMLKPLKKAVKKAKLVQAA
jgi:DNA topoisomerase-1